MISDRLDLHSIDSALAGTAFAGRMHHFASIGSTNTHAMEEARQGALHGSFYVADEQTAGRGRGGHSWHSVAGDGLYLSVLLRPALPAEDIVWLPLAVGLAAHRAIRESMGLTADLRWPNDLLIGPRKVGGILVETQSDSSRITAAVAGIGVNLHQQSFPSGLATPATSLDLETGGFVPRQRLLIALLQALDAELAGLASVAGRAAIPHRVAAVSTWVRGRRVAVHGPQECTGVTDGLDSRGFLRVQTAAGLVTVITGGLRDATA
jgi:BirA family transcriptional regulator, biotin operon repressor / biotin---[acetyl-CoA-carboxylase] ligase